MIHPTRTNLLILKEKRRSMADSIKILKSRRQALMREFLKTSRPFLKSRKEVSGLYARALTELAVSVGHEGRESVGALSAMALSEELRAEITEGSIWGLKYKSVALRESPMKNVEERGYDYRSTTVRLEETFHLFETMVQSILEIAAYESKLKRLGEEISRTTRRIRILEERVQPELEHAIKSIAQYLGERERESHYRLKLFMGGVS
jgi:V/A-type H+-transporting ATPase subunit D